MRRLHLFRNNPDIATRLHISLALLKSVGLDIELDQDAPTPSMMEHSLRKFLPRRKSLKAAA